jgi:hypothetical protein
VDGDDDHDDDDDNDDDDNHVISTEYKNRWDTT